jgi:hypothetical protein
MQNQPARPTFNADEMAVVNTAVSMAEELVSNYYKMSTSQWAGPKYDIKTLADLSESEIVSGPFAQIIRYEGKLRNEILGSSAYDFYKICIQDHAILKVLEEHPDITLAPFSLYVVAHELIHIVRFSRFLQNFNASDMEKLVEERRVHGITHDVLGPVPTPGMRSVLAFYASWRSPIDGLKSIS